MTALHTLGYWLIIAAVVTSAALIAWRRTPLVRALLTLPPRPERTQ